MFSSSFIFLKLCVRVTLPQSNLLYFSCFLSYFRFRQFCNKSEETYYAYNTSVRF